MVRENKERSAVNGAYMDTLSGLRENGFASRIAKATQDKERRPPTRFPMGWLCLPGRARLRRAVIEDCASASAIPLSVWPVR